MAVAGWGVVAGAAGSGFRVGWGMAGVVWFLFFGGFLLVLSGGAGHWVIILCGLDIFLMFPNFLRT